MLNKMKKSRNGCLNYQILANFILAINENEGFLYWKLIFPSLMKGSPFFNIQLI